MRQDILGRVPLVGQTILRAKYARSNSLYVCKVTGETKNGDPRVDQYTRNGKGMFTKQTYRETGTVFGDFVVLSDVELD